MSSKPKIDRKPGRDDLSMDAKVTDKPYRMTAVKSKLARKLPVAKNLRSK